MPRKVCLPRIAGTGALAVALAVLASAAPTAATETSLTLSNPRIVAHFDFAAGQTPESIALEPDGSADLSFALARQVARVTKHGDTEILATLPAPANPATPIIGAAVTTGLVRTHDGSLYVNYLTGTDDLTGVWRIAPDGSVARFAALPSNSFANGLALDKKNGVLYAADSFLGKVWRISLDDGAVTTWATGSELERTVFVGANGIEVRHGAVWVSNSDQGTLLRIPVEADGSAGAIETRATGLAGIDDFAFPRRDETVLTALNPSSEIAVVRPDGTHSIVLTQQDGLSNPTSVAVRHHKVYVPSAAFTTMEDPNLLLARLHKHQFSDGTARSAPHRAQAAVH
ncbi:SMP-30/gluconolactonase/LRE family protein [Streptomyces sp. NPDC002402]